MIDSSVTISGVQVDAAASYRITVNNFLADGGDRFSTLLAGTDRVNIETPEDDLAALIQYIAAHPGIEASGDRPHHRRSPGA